MEKTLAEYEKEKRHQGTNQLFRRKRPPLESPPRGFPPSGSYQIYYIDEANVAEFGPAGWVVPLPKYLPRTPTTTTSCRAAAPVASYKGGRFRAPDRRQRFLFYRRDLLEKAGIAVPKDRSMKVAAVKKTQQPAERVWLGGAGQRGSA